MSGNALKAAVLVSSDGVAEGTRVDRSGPLAREILESQGFDVTSALVCRDEVGELVSALRGFVADGVNLVVTSGGTGFGPRDVTPEATRSVIERQAPGFAEAVRNASPAPFGMLSRAVAGVAGETVIVNLPGSSGGVRDGLETLEPALRHACELARGDRSPHPHP